MGRILFPLDKKPGVFSFFAIEEVGLKPTMLVKVESNATPPNVWEGTLIATKVTNLWLAKVNLTREGGKDPKRPIEEITVTITNPGGGPVATTIPVPAGLAGVYTS